MKANAGGVGCVTEPETCTDCGGGSARTFLSGTLLCDRCTDRRVAQFTGYPELPDPPPDLALTGPDGRSHTMRFRFRRSPGGVVAEVEEVGQPAGEGYAAMAVGDQDADPWRLADAVKAQITTEIQLLYLEQADHRPGWILEGDEVAGRFVWVDHAEPYSVVVDGRTLTWEALGRALEPFEGFRFRLVIEE